MSTNSDPSATPSTTSKSQRKKVAQDARRANSSPHHYEPSRFEIPERTSSLTATDKQQQLLEIDHELKRRASQLSTFITPKASREYISTKRQCLELEEKKLTVLHEGLRQAFEQGKLDSEEYKRLVKQLFVDKAKITQEEITVKRNEEAMAEKLAQEDIEDEPDMTAAYANLLPLIWKDREKPAGYEIRDEAKHKSWKKEVRDHYNTWDPETGTLLWCPIVQKYSVSTNRTAAHIVPHLLGLRNIGIMFGEPDEGYNIVWSLRNGITMASYLEASFDRGDFVIVPAETLEGQPQEYRFLLMNEDYRKYPVGDSETKYGDLERNLVFKNQERPAARYLYYHFVSTLLRYQKYEKTDWAEKFLNTRTGSIWATPGPYLKRSVVRKLGEYVGDRMAVSEFSGGIFDSKHEGQTTVDEESETLAIKEIASINIENELAGGSS